MRVLLPLLFVASLARAEPLPQALQAGVRRLMAEHQTAGLSVGVRFHGQEWAEGFGFARLEPPTPATAETSYRMASVTKTFTAVAIMQLVEQGKVDLDAEVQTYLPSFPKKRWPVTVRAVLSHLSGIDTYRNHKLELHFKRHFTTAEALALFEDRALMHEPGTAFLYSTYGYDVLGAIVEAVSHESYGEYLQHHVFGPAGMTNSQVEDLSVPDPARATGYRIRGGRLVRSEQVDVSSRFGGGGTRSTVSDLLRYAKGLLEHSLVSQTSWAQMTLPARTADGRFVDYGLGLGVFPQHGHLLIEHMGAQSETTTLFLLVPSEGLAVALASNVEGQTGFLSDVAALVLETLLEDGVHRRGLYADDPADAVVLEGLQRALSYGIARHDGWGGSLPDLGSLDDAFARATQLLSRQHIAGRVDAARLAVKTAHHVDQGAIWPRVGEAMVKVLEADRGPVELRRYAGRGPVRFFADYFAACQRSACPGTRRFSPELEASVLWLAAQWEREVTPLERDLPEDLDALEPLTRASVLPDFSHELAQRAARLRKDGLSAQARATLELSGRLYPFASQAQLEAVPDDAPARADGRLMVLGSSTGGIPASAPRPPRSPQVERKRARPLDPWRVGPVF